MDYSNVFQGKPKIAYKSKGTPYPAYQVAPNELETHLFTRVRNSEDTRDIKPSIVTAARNTKDTKEDEDPVVFVTYTQIDKPSVTKPIDHIPADRSGDDTEQGVVIHTGNVYVCYSTDSGRTFKLIDPTTVFPNDLAGGLCCDQVVLLYIQKIDRFVWVMQHNSDITHTAPFRLALASPM